MLNTTGPAETGRHAHYGPLRVAVLCSDRAPGLLYLLNRAPDRGSAFDIVCVVTSSRTFDEEVRVERRGIPTLVHPIADFYERRGTRIAGDRETRRIYDAETVKRIEPYFPDLILLDGYLYLVTSPFLNMYRNRIINLHFSDLTERNADGSPRFPGKRAVRDVIAAGRQETRATVHLVNEAPDDGSPIVRSWPFPVPPMLADARTLGTPSIFKTSVAAHQLWMMQTAAGPLMAAALHLLAAGAFDADEAALQPPFARTAAWLLEEHGSLVAPDLVSADAAVLAHV
jgi:phosphoribosylglycinamide formyltransferase 1